MSSVDDRLRSGLALVERAGVDPAQLGAALLALHAAAAAYLDEALAALPELDPYDRAFLEAGGAGWLPRANLALHYGLVNREQRGVFLAAEQHAWALERGEPFGGSPHTVRSYGRFVAAFCRRQAFLTATERPASPHVPEDVTRPPAAAERWLRRAVRRARAPASWRAAIGTALLLGALAATLLLGALWAWPRPRPQAQVEILGTATVAVARAVQPAPPTPAVTRVRAPTPPTSGMTPAPTAPLAAIGAYPTAEVALARVVNLLGGPGLLHEAPAYTSPALPLLLREGDEVLLLPGAPVTADGVEWRLVQAGGLTGWCPAVNLRSRP